MDKSYFFDRNLLALSRRNPEVCSRLSRAETTKGRYKFIESRSGELIPAWVDPQGAGHPLHSVIDPRKEAKRLIDSVESEGNNGFLILLGLGGGYYAEAALERAETGMALVIEYDIDGLAELLCHRDYARLFGDARFRILADNSEEEIKHYILNLYQPVLYGGIRVIPLRSRTGLETKSFAPAGSAIEAAIDRVSADYSVQAHFGTRWFSNIIRNLGAAEQFQDVLPPVRRAAISAAGPSLSLQIPRLREKRKDLFLIAADTSLPCLLDAGIEPDAVISIDCQHISYYHFMDGLPKGALLFLDLASPPLVASRSEKPLFFSGGHPLTRYISRVWKPLPELDTSGGNVTYAALSLAEQLGAREIELYGADFSYPEGISYARGTYIYTFFGNRQNRFSSMEAQASAFLFRTPLEKKRRAAINTYSPDHPAVNPVEDSSGASWYYETKALKFYRERLEEKSERMEAAIVPIEGRGAPINISRTENRKRSLRIFSSGKAAMSAEEFLCSYREKIANIPEASKNAAEYLSSLKGEDQAIFATLLPAAAAIRRRHPQGDFRALLEETKNYCDKEIERGKMS